MSSRLLSFAAVIVFGLSSGAALACTGAKAKSADQGQKPTVSTLTQTRS